MAGSFSRTSFSSTSFSTGAVVISTGPPDKVNYGGGGGRVVPKKKRGTWREMKNRAAVLANLRDEEEMLVLSVIALEMVDA